MAHLRHRKLVRECCTGSVSKNEPARIRPDEELSRRMSRRARKDTAPELALRHELHRRGLRYRVQVKVPGNNRRTIDVAFTRAKVAVFVDGCFWHGCPNHHVQPLANSEWWQWKVESNRARDRDTDRLLRDAGWSVVRAWEHQDPSVVAGQVETLVHSKIAAPTEPTDKRTATQRITSRKVTEHKQLSSGDSLPSGE
ncbi:very short patch repair endonuclease [Nocardioides sp. G10]|uniref:Very short patch repair endonuclease n=2 Tax=Nocardioides baculatus TaxID=2801337 RepID=A0ABS1LC30_9ACTN|nr:very short patch repair endonuclease [Nocardioides baculatus]